MPERIIAWLVGAIVIIVLLVVLVNLVDNVH